jgi:hypothetical protein
MNYSELKIGDCFRWRGKLYARASLNCLLDNFDFQVMKAQHLNITGEDEVEKIIIDVIAYPNQGVEFLPLEEY